MNDFYKLNRKDSYLQRQDKHLVIIPILYGGDSNI